MLYVYELNWENKGNGREYFWSGSESQADARQNGPWEVSFPHKITLAELEKYCNDNWNLPVNEEGEEDLQDFCGIPAYGIAFLPQKVTVRISVDYENNAERWWAAFHAAQDMPAELQGTWESVEVDEDRAVALLEWCERLPGWETSPSYAPHPLLFQVA